jgi:hypothetical protein
VINPPQWRWALINEVRRARIGERAKSWIALTNGIIGEGRAFYRAVVDADLEGIVAKHLADAYRPKLARWHKILNRGYSQRRGRAEWSTHTETFPCMSWRRPTTGEVYRFNPARE